MLRPEQWRKRVLRRHLEGQWRPPEPSPWPNATTAFRRNRAFASNPISFLCTWEQQPKTLNFHPFDSKISKFISQIEKFSCGKNWNWRNEKLYGPGGEELKELSESAGEERRDEREVRRDRCSRRRWRRRRRIRGRHHLVRFSLPIN